MKIGRIFAQCIVIMCLLGYVFRLWKGSPNDNSPSETKLVFLTEMSVRDYKVLGSSGRLLQCSIVTSVYSECSVRTISDISRTQIYCYRQSRSVSVYNVHLKWNVNLRLELQLWYLKVDSFIQSENPETDYSILLI